MTRTHLSLLLFGAVVAAPGCDGVCEPSPAGPGNQDAASLEVCPPLPPGVEPIDGLAVARASDRFGGLVLTLSTRALACGEAAAQHDYCHDTDDRGLTIALPQALSLPGVVTLGGPVHTEFETPEKLAVGGGFKGASLELYTISDACVTGRITGMVALNGPFDGGFRAPRCAP